MIQRLKQPQRNLCFPTAVACITHLPLSEMPQLKSFNAYRMLSNPRSRWSKWCERNGVRFYLTFDEPPEGYYIGIYKPKRSKSCHALVCKDGIIIHDPSNVTQSYGKCIYNIGIERISVG